MTETLKSTPNSWLRVLANIAPPDPRRQQSAMREWEKINRPPSPRDLPIHETLNNLPGTRLKSRKPIWSNNNQFAQESYDLKEEWKHQWQS